MNTRTTMSEYNGHDILTIFSTEEGKYPTSIGFGKKKAQMILSNLDSIKAFVSNNERPVRTTPVPQVPQF